MLKRILLRNFQCHEEKAIQLESEGVTVIAGTSDTGKSSVIRALDWVRTNRPRGESFIRHKQSSCSVTVETEQGKVQRIRNKKVNGYRIGTTSHKAVGTGVPDEVFDTLRLADINVQRQHDPPFLLSKSPGEIGRALNSYADLDESDRVLAELNRQLSQEKSRYTQTEAELELIEGKLEHFTDLPKISGQVETGKHLQKELHGLLQNVQTLEKILGETEQREVQATHLESTERTRTLLTGLDTHRKKWQSLRNDSETLSELLSETEQNEVYTRIDVPKEQLGSLTELNQLKQETQDESHALEKVLIKLETSQDHVKDCSKALRKAREDLKSFAGTNCPTCGQTIRKTT